MSATPDTMMQNRRRSVPPGRSTNTNPLPPIQGNTKLATTSSASTGPLPPSVQSSKLLAQADALAKMTFELNLRTVSGHADRLERDIHALVVQTKQDKDFQRENQDRLVEMMAEIQSVRAHMTTLQGGQEDVKGGFEKLQRETTYFVEGFREEMERLKGGIDEMSSQLDQFATIEDVRDEILAKSMTDTEIDGGSQRRFRKLQLNSSPEIHARVQEAIKSTRRWNREHKTTHLPDAQFAANYLKKQLQRDPAMAVLLQRSLLKRIRLRNAHTPGETWSQPQTLDELCRVVTWKEVIDMVKDVLVVNEQRAMGLLRRASGP